MSTKKQTNWVEAARNAVSGYATVILSIICFLIALVIIVAGVRIIAGSGATTSNMPTVTTSTTAGINQSGMA